MWLLAVTTVLLAVFHLGQARQAPTPNNDDMTAEERLKYCTPWGRVQIAIKNKNGNFSHVDKVPWDLLCALSPPDCSFSSGQPVMLEEMYKNMSLEDVGLYGLNSLRSPEFARLVLFKTKQNHSDETERHGRTGCEGTLHPDLMPAAPEPWIALIKRGGCFFTEKLANAVDTHGARGFVVYNDDDEGNPEVIMNITTLGLTTIMINNSMGLNLERLDLLLNVAEQYNLSLPYTSELYVNITFDHCAKHTKKVTPVPVTVVTITFVVVMIIALTWLVVYYFQKHRNANKQMMLQLKLQKAAKKALKKIGERVIKETDEEGKMDQQQDCTYCLDPLMVGETIRQLPCRHKFHKECVDEWLIHNRTCPNCHGDILVATGVTIRGIKSSAEDEEIGREMTDINPESRRQLLSDSQAIAGHEDEGDSQGFGSQMIPGSQLLTDGKNMFLYVPNDVDLPTDSTIQIENPPMQLHQQQLEDQQLLASSSNDTTST